MYVTDELGLGSASFGNDTRRALARVAVLWGVWLPFFGLVTFILPKFAPIFAKIAERGELPTLTLCTWQFGRLNTATSGLPTWIFYAVLSLSDITLERMTRFDKLGLALYRVWFTAIILEAFIAIILVFLSIILLPVCGKP
jgi:hypothetical protein